MKDITRVHIAGVAYDIETGAKHALQEYLDAIKNLTGDGDLLADVESRIVELLSERSITKGSVIRGEDVDAIVAQLGQPEEFSDEGDMVTGPAGDAGKKLYRDSANAWIGGVAAGIARYYGTRAWWIRLLLLASIPLTSGISVVVYALVWLVIPATKTPSDVLRLDGKPVTVTAINGISGSGTVNPGRDRRIVRGISIAAGVGLLGLAVSGLVLTGVGVVFGINTGITPAAVSDDLTRAFALDGGVIPWIAGSAILTAVTGLAAVLLLAYGLITWHFRRPVVVSLIVLVVLGFAGGAATGVSGLIARQRATDAYARATETRTAALPQATGATALMINNLSSADVRYVVGDGQPRIETSSFHGTLKPQVAVRGTTIAVTVPKTADRTYFYGPTETVTIYGPVLTALTATNGPVTYSGDDRTLDTVAVTAGRSAGVTLTRMSVTNATVTLGQFASVDFTGANVSKATVTGSQATNALFGTIAELTYTMPQTCASDGTGIAGIAAENVTSGTVTANGAQRPATSYRTPCLTVSIGDDADTSDTMTD